MGHLLVPLPDAVHGKQRRTEHFLALTLQQRRPDNHVCVAGFIFERHKQHAVDAARALTHRHQAARARQLPVAIALQRRRRQQATPK